MQVRTTFRERFQYRFDNFMAAGARSIFLALIIMFLSAFLLTGAVRIVVSKSAPAADFAPKTKPALNDDIWNNFMQIIDPGAIAEDNDSPWYLKLVGIVSIFFGLIFFSAVIAFITTQLDLKIESLKKGRSRVLEKDHIIILGWGDRVAEIIREIIIANESEKDGAVVVLSETPKEEMDDYFNEVIPPAERKTTRIITRTGIPSSLDALERVAVTECKSVVIQPLCNEAAPLEEKMISDAKTLKSLLAVVAASREDKTQANIITETFNKKNRDLLISLAPENITMIDSEDVTARMIVQTSRSTGLAAAYSQLIGFEGCEFYFHRARWGGRTFGEIAFHFADGVIIGLRNADGAIRLKPPGDTVLRDDDHVIIIAEDDSAIRFREKPVVHPMELRLAGRRLEKKIEREMIIGWNTKAPIIIDQYTDYILENSVIDVVLSPDDLEAEREVLQLKELNPGHKINILRANPMIAEELEGLYPETYNNVILLNKVEDDLEKVDSATITLLLQLRRLFARSEQATGHKVNTQIVSEVMDSHNLELVSRTGVNDFIISGQMVSKIIAQAAENPDTMEIYRDLFREEGAEIYVKPIWLYLDTIPADPIRFADLMKLAQHRDECCIGYRIGRLGRNVEEHFGVVLNPPKDRAFRLQPEDYLIVLAEDEL